MDKQSELRQWIEIANNDLTAAQYLAKVMRPISYEIICFHCQQAAEKYLKWVLVLHDIDPPKIHDLEELEKLCENIAPQVVMEGGLNLLSPALPCPFLIFGVRRRYRYLTK